MRPTRSAALARPSARPLAGLLAAAVALFACNAATAQVGDEDSGTFATPRVGSASWNLDFTTLRPRAISVPDLGGVVRWYWYIPYTVVNNSVFFFIDLA